MILRHAFIVASFLLIDPAFGAEQPKLSSCNDAGVGIESINSPPKTFYNGHVTLYSLDTVEPALSPAGIALVIPSTAEGGGSICFAATGFSSLGIDKITSQYDNKKGLLLIIPNRMANAENSTSSPAPDLKIRVNLQTGTALKED